MNINKFFYFAIGASFLAFANQEVFAQSLLNRVEANASGNILRVKRSDADNVVGSPYLVDKWSRGNVKFKDNTAARNGELKYDVTEDLLVVKGTEGQENIFTDPVDEFTLTVNDKLKLFKTGFTGDKVNEKSYLEVIHNGKTKLLKRYFKTLIESKTYNSASVTKKLEESNVYFIAKSDNKLIPVKRNEKSILEALQNNDLAKYVKENKLNLKSEEDIAKLLAYYDTIV